MTSIKVFGPGTPVLIGDSIPAIIIQVSIGLGEHVAYQVVWWEDRTRRTEWLLPMELKENHEADYEVGFHTLIPDLRTCKDLP